MKAFSLFLLLVALHGSYAPPVTQNKEEQKNDESADHLEDYMEYHRYLREVVGALESDPEFRQKLEKATEDDIRSGKIAGELEFVSHNVRTRLDEIKRTELQRLRKSMDRVRQIEQNNDLADPVHHHLDQTNPHTFEIEDLKKLIAKTTEDLAEADRKRREEFKEYEMQKELEKQKKLNSTSGEEREKLEKLYKEQEEKHKKHVPLHEPGHKKQLEEVWEEQDHMQQEFDPRTFFTLHDLDGNNLWDQDEVKALFIKELDKMYAAGAPEDDMRERAEEMERMRETVFREVDVNRDGFIDFEEFMAQTKKNEFQQDNGWQTLDQQRPYTDEELEAYIRSHQQYQYPPQGYQPPPPGYHHGQVPPQAYHPSAGGYHPNQMPAGYQQVPQQAYQHQQVPPVGGYQPGHVPQTGGYHPAQAQQHEQAHGQYYPQQVPPQQHAPPQPQAPVNKDNQLPDLNTNEVYPQHISNNIPQQQSQPNQPQQYQQQQQQYQQQQNPQYQQYQNQANIQHQPPQQQQQQSQQPPVAQQQHQQSAQAQPNPQPVVSQNVQPSTAQQPGGVNVQQGQPVLNNQPVPNVKVN